VSYGGEKTGKREKKEAHEGGKGNFGRRKAERRQGKNEKVYRGVNVKRLNVQGSVDPRCKRGQSESTIRKNCGNACGRGDRSLEGGEGQGGWTGLRGTNLTSF